MPCVEPLFVGKRTAALSYKSRFQSRVAARHKMPALPANLAEGIVLRPCSGARQLVKLKIREFSELADDINVPSGSAAADLTPIVARINCNRFNAVRSKHGDAANADELAILLLADAMDELYEDSTLCGWAASLSPQSLAVARSLVQANVSCWLRSLSIRH
jgi:hypothetical protein